MKSRLIWIAVILAAAGGFYYSTIHPMLTPSPPPVRKRINKDYQPPEIPPPPLPEPKIEMPTVPLPPPSVVIANAAARREEGRMQPLEVPIQNQATIDFSPGAPVVRADEKEKAIIDKALKEMLEATKDVTFPPTKAPTQQP